MSESDKASATTILLRTAGQLLALTWLLAVVFAVLAGWFYAVGAMLAAAAIAGVVVLGLAGSGWLAVRRIARLAGFGHCGLWDHCAAVRLLYRQCAVLMTAVFLAALAFWAA